MRTLLLLLLSLMTGCEAVSNVKGCRDGWVEFTCNYQRSGFTLTKSGHTLMQSSKNNEWETTNSVSLYRDTNNKKVRVLIKNLKQEDFESEYHCKKQGSNFDTVKLDKDRGCQGQFIQTVYRTAKTAITCNYPRNRDESDVLFLCKDKKINCEDILSTESSPKSSETFTLTKTNTGFTVSISNVSSHHAGVYWCGVKSNKGRYRAGFRKIQLEVKDIRIFTSSLTTGQNFTYWCAYPDRAPINKFICKGEDPSICEPLVNATQLGKNTGRFSMEDDRKKRNITITVREVTTDDTGTYWCGAESTDNKSSNPFFHRLSMIVGPPTAYTPTSTSPTSNYSTSSAVSTTTTTTASHETGAGDSRLTIIAVVVCVALLALLLFLVLLYKRREHTKNTRNEDAQNDNETLKFYCDQL